MNQDDTIPYVKNEWAEMWIDGGLMYIKYFPNVIVDLKAAQRILEDRLKLANGKEYFVHGDCRGVKYWTREARAFQSTKENHDLIIAGTVLYTESYALNVIANFYIKFNKQWVPLKFCCSEKEALEWLNKMRSARESQ